MSPVRVDAHDESYKRSSVFKLASIQLMSNILIDRADSHTNVVHWAAMKRPPEVYVHILKGREIQKE